MKKLNKLLIISTGMLLCTAVSAAELTNTLPPENPAPISQLVRGAEITVGSLGTIADVSSAKNQKGDPVVLDEAASYKIASFTRTTLSIVPENGGVDDVITVDLKPEVIKP